MVNNPNATLAGEWQTIINWFHSLYYIEFNFFGYNFCLMDILMWSGVCVIITIAFHNVFGFTQEFDISHDRYSEVD